MSFIVKGLMFVALIFGGCQAVKKYQERPRVVDRIEVQNVDLSPAVIPTQEPKIYILWTTWCPASRAMLENGFWSDPRIKDRIVLISDGEAPEKVISTMRERSYSFKSLIDTKRNFARAMKISSYPSFFIQDSYGRISLYEFPTVYRPATIVDTFVEKLQAF